MVRKRFLSLTLTCGLLVVGLVLIPISASAQVDNIGNSSVTGLTPDPIPTGPQTLCFTVNVQSPDIEYMDRFDVDLPDEWTVDSVAPDSVPPANGCPSALPPVAGIDPGNVVYWQSSGYVPGVPTGCGAWAGGSAPGTDYEFCIDVTVPTCDTAPWNFAWNVIGDSFGDPPHSAAGTYGPVDCDLPRPAVELTKTVGTVPAVCAPTTTISVATGADVYYCYHIENTGGVTFEYHTLVDDQLGTLLSNAPVTLAPGATYDHIEMATINAPVINHATWTAANAVGGFAVDDTINYDMEDISATGTPFSLGDDATMVLPVGFSFDFYGVPYTDIEISSNGFLSVNAAGDSGCCTGDPLPDPNTPNGTIAGWWEDLDPGEAGAEFYYETMGTAPNRRFLVSVINVQHFPSDNPVTLQYKLYETTGVIEVHYLAAPGDGAGTHSAGVENQDGSAGVQYYLGLGPLTAGAPLAVRYNPTTTIEATSDATAEVLLADPNIDVNPLALATNQMVNTVVVETLDISNTGVGDLDWTIQEDGAVPVERPALEPGTGSLAQAAEISDGKVFVSEVTPHTGPIYASPDLVLYDNGPLVNSTGTGSGGADESMLQTALGMGSYGMGHQLVEGFRIADDFQVTAPGGWTIDTITFFAYQTGSTTTSTFTSMNLQIWDGPPDNPGSSVVWGDTTTNVLASSTFTNIYRVLDTASGNTDRPIMANVATVGTALAQGTYWLDWQADGSLTSGPWAPPITIDGQTTTGNAMQWTTVWAPAEDGGTFTQQGFPFIVEGSGDPVACLNPGDIPWLSLSPDMGTTPPMGTTQVDVTFDSTGLPVATYTANLCIESNDPDAGPGNGTELVVVPVEMVVVIPVELQSFSIE